MRNDIVRQAVAKLKDCPYKVTAIKVEFEAHLDRDNDEWEDDDNCYSDIMKRLRHFGLADDNLNPKSPLMYAQFYNDGSVDSEFTFTLLLDNPENIFLLPTIMDAWNGFCAEVTAQPDVEGAGMHMALLNSAGGDYPTRMSQDNIIRFGNFKRSMTLLLPTLYFLGTHTHLSRALEYRRPEIHMSDASHGYSKFNAVTYKDGALEFRIFDTCYHNPLAILDNVVVIANTMKYWKSTYLNPGLDKIARRVNFGNDSSYELSRFYTSLQHIDLLNQGLLLLKPAYYSIKQLKQQRNFKVNKRDIAGTQKRLAHEARLEYEEYCERFEWNKQINKYQYVANVIKSLQGTEPIEIARQRGEAEAAKRLETEEKNKAQFSYYLQDKLDRWHRQSQGNFTLSA